MGIFRNTPNSDVNAKNPIVYCGGERQRDRVRQTDKQGYTWTYRDTERERQTERQINRGTHGHTERQRETEEKQRHT